jgi:hypothetical protein
MTTIELPNGYQISDDKQRLDLNLIHHSYWSPGIPRGGFRTCFRGEP